MNKKFIIHLFYLIFSNIMLIFNINIFKKLELLSICGVLVIGIIIYYLTYKGIVMKKEEWIVVAFSIIFFIIYYFLPLELKMQKSCKCLITIYLLINFSLFFLCKSKNHKKKYQYKQDKRNELLQAPGRKGRVWIGYNAQKYEYLKHMNEVVDLSRIFCGLSYLCVILSILISILEYC